MNIESTGTAQQEPVFSNTTEQQETTEKKIWTRKEKARYVIPKNRSTGHHSVVLLCK